jgi:hypothetical protein
MGIDPNDFRKMQERVQSARVGGIVKRVKDSIPKTKHKSKSYNPAIVIAFFQEEQVYGVIMFEYQFHSERKWRFDIAFPQRQVAIEVQGGIWTAGRHNRGVAMLKEWEKLNCAAELGWRILYVQPCDLCTTEFANTIKRALRI